MKRKIQQFRLYMVGLAVFLFGGIAWAATNTEIWSQLQSALLNAEELSFIYGNPEDEDPAGTASVEVTDVLNQSVTGITTSSYVEFIEIKATSDAVYAGLCAGGNESIQLRSKNNNAGVVTTTSGGKAKKIVVVWQDATADGRTLNVYGKNEAYVDATDLYDSDAQGTLLGTIVKGTSTELEIDGDYAYIGFRSFENAMYLTSVSITWDATSSADPSYDPYEAALTAIGDGGNYYISTDVEGTKYYITADGKLTSSREDGCIFTLTQVEGGAFKDYGYLIDGGKRFSNAPLSNNQAVLDVSNFSTSTNNRAEWEAQVLFLQDGKYAIRATNAAYGESGWADAGRVFFTWKVEDVAIPQYTYDQVYQWNLEVAAGIVNVTYRLVESDGTTEVFSVTKKQEGNSEISVPASLTSNFLYDYAVEGTIDTEDCTITVVRTVKSGLVHALTDLSNAKAYTIACDRGTFLTDNGYMVSTAKGSFASSDPGIFAIVNYEDNFYLYSIADKKFVTNSGALADLPSNGVLDAIQMEPKSDPYFLFYFTDAEGTNCAINTSGNYPYGYVINSWMSADSGNQYYMVEVADFDATEALTALEAYFHPSYFVTYVVKDATGNELFVSEPEPTMLGSKITSLPNKYRRDFTWYDNVDVTISEEETVVEFTAYNELPFETSADLSNATWYNMTIRGNYYVAADEEEPYYPRADKDLSAYESQWAFAGDTYNGIVVYNKAFGSDYSLTKDDNNVVMRDGEYRWEIGKNNDGFFLREIGTEYNCVNQNGGSNGPLQFWNSAASPTDNGSTFRVQASTAVEFAVPTFNIEDGTQAAPNILPAGSKLKVNYTAGNLKASGYNADDLKVKVTVMLSGDLPENLMTMGSETAHRVMGESFYIPLGETDFPVALKPGYVYQTVAVISAELVKNAETEYEEVIAVYEGAPLQLHWIGSEAKVIYIETDMTSQFAALTNKDNWTTGAGGKAGYTATNFCPAVTPNGLAEVQVCEFYETNCDRTGDLLYQTVTGLTEGTYTIELYGGAAYTFGRGFTSEAFSEGTWNAGDKITENTGVTLYATTSEGTFGGEIPIYYATNFPDGAAVVTLEGVKVGSNGEVKIGMSKTSKSTNWHVIQLKSVIAAVDANTILAASVEAANAIDRATIPNALVYKLDETVADYNVYYDTAEDYLAAINAIDAVVAEAKAYAPLTAVLEKGEEYKAHSVNEDALIAYDEAIDEVRIAYDEATVADVAAAIATVEAALPALAKSQTLAGADMTVFITNPNIDGSADGWTCEKPNGGNGPMFGTTAFEYWKGNASEGAFDYWQEISGLPNGIYTVSADMYNSMNGVAGEFVATSGVYGQSNYNEAYGLVDIDGTELNTYTTDQVFVFDGTLRIGVKNAETMAARWFVADNFKLTLVRPLDEDVNSPYYAALNSIEDGAIYRIKAEVDGTTYYLTADGTITTNETAATGFTITTVSDGQFYDTGFFIDGGSYRFSNPPGTDESSLKRGRIHTTPDKRSTWEAQVLFLNEDGKYAVRATNVAAGATSGWSWVANSYWTVEWSYDYDDYVAQYDWDPAYIWEFERMSSADENAARQAAAELVQSWIPFIQTAKGLIQDAGQWYSNAKERNEGSYGALIDGDNNTYFQSMWSSGADDYHYLQAELPEAAQQFRFYFKKRAQNNNYRPTVIGISASNDGEYFDEFEYIEEGLPTTTSEIDYLSQEIDLGEPYKYIRFTVYDTNSGSYDRNGFPFFSVSEFYILPTDIPEAAAAYDIIGTPIYQLDVDEVYAVDSALKEALKVVYVTYALYDEEGTLLMSKQVLQDANSEIVIPAGFTDIDFYKYEVTGEIGEEDCEIQIVRSFKDDIMASLADLNPNKAYTISCQRGSLFTMNNHLYSTCNSEYSEIAPSPFAIISYNDNNYLYSVNDGKFVTCTGELAKIPVNGVNDAIYMEEMDQPYVFCYFSVDGNDMALNTNGNRPYGYVINSWMNPDAGNMYCFVEAVDFDPAEILATMEESIAKNADYNRALNSIEGGEYYRISTEFDGATYYLNGKGYLTENFEEAVAFRFDQIWGQNNGEYGSGFFMESNGQFFTSAHGTDEQTLKSGRINQSGRSRYLWDAQVLFMNEDGKYAVRSTNVSAADSLGLVGSAYWTVDQTENGPVAQYSFDENYIWNLETVVQREFCCYLVVNGDMWCDDWTIQSVGATPVAPDWFYEELHDLYTLTPNVDVITEETEEVYFTATWNGPFKFSESYENAQWYNMTICGDYFVALDETEPYRPSVDKDLEAEESLWAFLPDENNPFRVRVINHAAGPDNNLAEDGDYPVMRDYEFYWNIYGNNDGFVLSSEWADDGWINQSGDNNGYLGFWWGWDGRYEEGSTFRVYETEYNEFQKNINIRSKKTLDLAGKQIPADYRPDINVQQIYNWVGNSENPTTLGALNIIATDTTELNVNNLTMSFYPAQTNYFRNQWNTPNLYYTPQHTTLIADGPVSAEAITIRMALTDGQWNFITVPYDVRVSDIYCENEETDWVIRRYDGQARANMQMDATWINVGADEILEPGKGYIMHCSYSPNWLYSSQTFYFPALNTKNKNLIFSDEDRLVPLNEYESEFAHNSSWNLIGNPYAAYVEIGATDFNSPITVWDGTGNYLAYSPIDDEYILSPGEAFFVQRPAGQSAIIFDAESRMSWYDTQKGVRYAKSQLRKSNPNRHVFNLFLSDGEQSNRTRVVINPDASMAYESSCDAAKFPAMKRNTTQIYSIASGVDYSINERPLADGTVQLAARFAKTGQYTLRMETSADYSVILTDEATGIAMELNSVDGYTFDALAGDANNRFRLQISKDADAIQMVSTDDLRNARIFTLDGKRIPANKQLSAGVYLIQKNGIVRKASVK